MFLSSCARRPTMYMVCESNCRKNNQSGATFSQSRAVHPTADKFQLAQYSRTFVVDSRVTLRERTYSIHNIFRRKEKGIEKKETKQQSRVKRRRRGG